VREFTLHEIISLALAIRREPWKYSTTEAPGGNNSVSPGLRPFALKGTASDAPGRLYSLADDPGETTNLYFEHPEIVKGLKSRLEEFQRSGRDAPLTKRANDSK
jgi:hypothetical protein